MTPDKGRNTLIIIGTFVGMALLVMIVLYGRQATVTVDTADTSDGGTGEDAIMVQSTCTAQGALPDPVCTPGAADPRVTQENIQETICVPGYTGTVRPSTSYTNPLKRKQMARYGVPDGTRNELDHLIPLAVGGAPRHVTNLWPQTEEPRPGFREKDRVERLLQLRVCRDEITLAEAQQGIATDWLQYLPDASVSAMDDDFDDDGEP